MIIGIIIGFIIGIATTMLVRSKYHNEIERMYKERLSMDLNKVYQWVNETSSSMRKVPDLQHVADQLDNMSVGLFKEIANLEISGIEYK